MEEDFASATSRLKRHLRSFAACAALRLCLSSGWLANTSPHTAVITKKDNTIVNLLAFIPFYPVNVLVRPTE